MNKNEIQYTTYDRLLRAWENSMELVRDYEMYSKRITEEKIKKVFKEFAEQEGFHAAKFRDLILDYKKNSPLVLDAPLDIDTEITYPNM